MTDRPSFPARPTALAGIIALVSVLLAVSLGLAACASDSGNVPAPGQDTSYIQFRGNASDARFTVKQNGKTVRPFSEIETSDRYAIRSGRYQVAIQRRGRMILDRTFYLPPGTTTDIWVR